MTGIAYVAYGAFAIYVASLNVADLSPKMVYDLFATGATWEEWKKSFFRGGVYSMVLGVVTVIAGIGIIRRKSWEEQRGYFYHRYYY